MKKATIVLVCLTLFYTLNAQSVYRYSNNPIPNLNVIGIAISANVESANKVIKDVYKDKMNLEIPFTCFVDPTYEKLDDRPAIDLSFFGKSVTGDKYKSKINSELKLNAPSFSILLTDRQGRVRAYSQAVNFDLQGMNKIIEELLLNLDGEEITTVNSNESDESNSWQTLLAKQIEEKENKGKLIIDFGANEKKWYKLLGEKLPDVELKTITGDASNLQKIIENKVSLLFVFEAATDEAYQVTAVSNTLALSVFNEFYKTFGTGKIEPGDKFEERCKNELRK